MSICSSSSCSNAFTSFILPISEPCSRLILPACTGSSQRLGLLSSADNRFNLTFKFFHCNHQQHNSAALWIRLCQIDTKTRTWSNRICKTNDLYFSRLENKIMVAAWGCTNTNQNFICCMPSNKKRKRFSTRIQYHKLIPVNASWSLEWIEQ